MGEGQRRGLGLPEPPAVIGDDPVGLLEPVHLGPPHATIGDAGMQEDDGGAGAGGFASEAGAVGDDGEGLVHGRRFYSPRTRFARIPRWISLEPP